LNGRWSQDWILSAIAAIRRAIPGFRPSPPVVGSVVHSIIPAGNSRKFRQFFPMSSLSSLVYPATVRANVAVDSKKAFFAVVGKQAATALGLDANEVADALMERERLGSTGFGRGVSLPHARISGLSGVRGLVFQLARPIDFDAVDALPVDVAFVLLSPADAGADHLKALAQVSRFLRDDGVVARLRGARSAEALYVILSEEEARDAA
jgi:nitrogen PTS system EIIA component